MIGLFKPRRWFKPSWLWTSLCVLIVCGCNGGDEGGERGVQGVDCRDLCSKTSECLGTDEGECQENCLYGYEDPEIQCLRLCDRQSECFLYALCAGYCIISN